VLVGRGAEGHFDAGAAIHIRLHTRSSVGDIAAAIVQFGYDEPAFNTAETRHGRLSQVRLTEEQTEVVLTRCPPDIDLPADADVFTGRPITTMTLAELRRRLNERS